MKTFYLTSYADGSVIKKVRAVTMRQAKNNLESQCFDCTDDYFLQEAEEREAQENARPIPYRFTI